MAGVLEVGLVFRDVQRQEDAPSGVTRGVTLGVMYVEEHRLGSCGGDDRGEIETPEVMEADSLLIVITRGAEMTFAGHLFGRREPEVEVERAAEARR